MAGIKGRSGPPGNQNGFKHGLAALSVRRGIGRLSEQEQSIRDEILRDLIADKGGDEQVSTTTKIMAELIASDAAWLVALNKSIDNALAHNPKARDNPAALAKLDGYRRPVLASLSGNLPKYGFERVRKVQTLQEIVDSMADETAESPTQDSTGTEETDESNG